MLSQLVRRDPHQLLRTLPCLFLHDIRLVWIPAHFSERDTQLPSPNPLKTNLLPRHLISNNSITLVKKKHPTFFPKYSHNRLTASTSHIKQLHHFNERNTELPSPNTPTTNLLPLQSTLLQGILWNSCDQKDIHCDTFLTW